MAAAVPPAQQARLVVPEGQFDALPAAAPAGRVDTVIQPVALMREVDFPIYSIRNGLPQEVKPYLSRPSIPDWSKWVVVPGIQSRQAFEHLDVIIRSHIYNVSAHAPVEWSAQRKRKVGFMLGVARASMMVNYQIGPGELMAGEMLEGPIGHRAAAAAVAGPNAVDAVAAAWVVRLAPLPPAPAPAAEGAAPAPADPNGAERARRQALMQPLELDDQEEAVLAILARSGQTVLPLQGFSIISDGHHYLSEGNKASFRAFANVERQLWNGPGVGTFFSADMNEARDVLWHKTGHPVNVPLKLQLATCPEVKGNLIKAGLGSAASRLPAVEMEARAGTAYLALAKTVDALWGPYGGEIDYTYLEGLMDALGKSPVGREIPGAGHRVTKVRATRDEPEVFKVFTSRDEILREVTACVGRSAADMAVAGGFYKAYLEAQEIGGRGEDSLLSAFSIKNLEKQHHALHLRGVEMHADYRAHKADLRREKHFDVMRVSLL